MIEVTDIVDNFSKQLSYIKEALRSILLLDKNISGATESLDAEVAAAITKAFEDHVPDFRYEEESNTVDGKFKVENAIRSVCGEIVKAASEASQHVMKYHVEGAFLPSIPQLLDLARYLSHILLGDTVLFLSLISDLVETCTIDEGTDIFLYLEKCVPFMKAKYNFEPQASTAKLSVLRICNMLLRRLSRASHVLLAGRIHLFLAQILPSTDRSAVNANGMVNDSHAVEIEDVPEGFLGTDGKPVDVGLYKQFWALQNVFQNPTKATDPNLWLQVHASIKAVLADFAKVKPTVVSGGINSSSLGATGSAELLTVKYLSSPKLLNLQLRDAGFRRHFLVQCLALLQACSRKSLARQETFRIKQQGEAEDLQEQLYQELERTPQHGGLFARAVRSLMHHEDQWADWKAEGAKSFERPKRPLEASSMPAKRRRANPPEAVKLGSRELTRLWNITPENADAHEKANRRLIPTLREFLEPVVAEMDPDDAIEEQYKKKNEHVYRWEALRQISKVSRVQLSAVVKTPDQNLEEAVRRIFPGDVPGSAKAPENASSLADETILGSPPSPGPELLAAVAKTTSGDAEDGEAAMDTEDATLESKEAADQQGTEPAKPAGSAQEAQMRPLSEGQIADCSQTADLANGEEEAGPGADSKPESAAAPLSAVSEPAEEEQEVEAPALSYEEDITARGTSLSNGAPTTEAKE